MKYRSGNEIRSLFLKFFESKGHMVEPSANLIPKNDPTLLWINAGVAALKKYFDGSEKPKCNRITNAQKSIRTNDIENVGKTARHHTFFEMLGNFSIGDYFKEDAINYAWEFLTSEEYMGMDKDKLYISVYTDDDVAYKIWTEEIGVDPSHILKTDDNFWEIGEGPSGPDSEIFYDRGEKYDPDNLGEKLFFEEMENDRYVEVWNIVFSQYDAKMDLDRSEYQELPQKNIDTGMGLERLVSIVQEGETNFDTDLFLPIINAVEKISKFPYEGEYKMAYRVIADHIRTLVFALSDGALFANNGRGYVLRRVLRRGVRYGMKLGLDKPFMYELVDIVTENMKEFYPYLEGHKDFNKKLIKQEEEAFHKTLTTGEKLLNDALANVDNDHKLAGDIVFKLYDTYGFPYELTEEIALEHGVSIDKEGFDKAMAAQKERARNARDVEQSMSSQSEALMSFETPSEFIGYDHLTNTTKVIGLYQDGELVEKLSGKGFVMVEKTCFYAEMGGEVSDSGVMVINDHEYEVEDVKKAPHGQFMHLVDLKNTKLKVGDEVILCVDELKRHAISKNHTATHLLHAALKEVLGGHINQAGSYVDDKYLRFDFSHFEKISDEDLLKIENLINEVISNNVAVTCEYMSIDEAKNSGAMALFDEKYGDEVRVVTAGDFSKELCGGCHVKNVSEIGLIKIIGEESVGSGIRRITAVTALEAIKYQNDILNDYRKVASLLKVKNLNDTYDKLSQLIDKNNEYEAMIKQLEANKLNDLANTLRAELKNVNGSEVLVKEVKDLDGKKLKEMVADLVNVESERIVFLANVNNGKLMFVSGASDSLVKKGINCGQLVKLAATTCDGNGGGKPNLAQAGGKNLDKLAQALQLVEENIAQSL